MEEWNFYSIQGPGELRKHLEEVDEEVASYAASQHKWTNSETQLADDQNREAACMPRWIGRYPVQPSCSC
eukprot:1850696-Amphidinium_carterae.1